MQNKLKKTIIDFGQCTYGELSEITSKYIKSNLHSSTLFNVPFNEGVFKIEPFNSDIYTVFKNLKCTMFYYYKIINMESNNIKIYMEVYVSTVTGTHLQDKGLYIHTNGHDNIEALPAEGNTEPQEQYHKRVSNGMSYVLEWLIYINMLSNNRETVYKEIESNYRKKYKGSISPARKKIQVLNDDRIIYIESETDKINKYLNKGKSINKAFPVRGHYRQYKSGLRIWIKQYNKGNNKELECSTYVVK